MKTILTVILLALAAFPQGQERGIDLNAVVVQYRAKSDAATQEFIAAIDAVRQLSQEVQRLRAENDSLRNELKPKTKEKK